MQTYTAAQVTEMLCNGNTLPAGVYPDRFAFPDNITFSAGCIFGDYSTFGDNCKFGKATTFGCQNSIGRNATLESDYKVACMSFQGFPHIALACQQGNPK